MLFSYPVYHVDAFSDKVFGGNYAAVCPLERWLSDDILQSIAAENNLPETAFFIPSADKCADFELRWFTPTVEVDLCGHATLASAHVIQEALHFSEPIIRFATLSGILCVTKVCGGYSLDFPACEYHVASDDWGVATALGVTVDALYHSDDWLAIVKHADLVMKAKPDMALLSTLPARGVLVSAPADNGIDFVSRAFFPKLGIDEDPVTGSAHCLLAPYWANRLGKKLLVAQQGLQRRGKLTCHVLEDRVLIKGQAVTYMQGRYRI